jgi:hypothetical protein
MLQAERVTALFHADPGPGSDALWFFANKAHSVNQWKIQRGNSPTSDDDRIILQCGRPGTMRIEEPPATRRQERCRPPQQINHRTTTVLGLLLAIVVVPQSEMDHGWFQNVGWIISIRSWLAQTKEHRWSYWTFRDSPKRVADNLVPARSRDTWCSCRGPPIRSWPVDYDLQPPACLCLDW